MIDEKKEITPMADSENNERENALPERKKINLQEAIRQKLENKKQAQSAKKPAQHSMKSVPTMKSQLTKKPNNQHKRTGV